MGYRKRLRHRGTGPLVDPMFVEELSGQRDRTSREKASVRHKTSQLCRQVQRAIGLSLSGECDDDVLRAIWVGDVSPAPGASRLLVQLIVPARANASVADVLERVERVRGMLRAEVARAITRKRAPELVFVPTAENGVTP